MTQEKIDMYILTNQKYFPEDKIFYIREKLVNIPDEKFSYISSIPLKEPTTTLVISILLGSLGVDRFMIGDTGMGILKLLTGGLCGIMTIYDWFTISGKVKTQNLNNLLQVI